MCVCVCVCAYMYIYITGGTVLPLDRAAVLEQSDALLGHGAH
jgi:hypothetical protein